MLAVMRTSSFISGKATTGIAAGCAIVTVFSSITPVTAAPQLAVPSRSAPAKAAVKSTDPEARIISNNHTGTLYTAGKNLYGPLLSSRALLNSAATNSRIKRLIKGRLNSRAIGKSFSYTVTDVATGKTIASRGGRIARLTASNMKIMIAAAALQTLGPDHQFSTKVVSLGQGKIALVGGGDATLTRSGLSKLASRTAKALAKDAAKGAQSTLAPLPGKSLTLYLDDSMYPAPTKPGGWTNSYQPYVVRPVRPLGILGDYVWDSSIAATNYFKARLQAHGIKVVTPKDRRTTTAPNSEPIAEFLGTSLSDQIYNYLQVSENNIGEMLFRNIAYAKGYPTSWSGARAAVRNVLATELKIPLTNTRIDDGSGVARSDRLTTKSLVVALQRIADKARYPRLAPIYYGGSLPLSGVTGTLSSSSGRYNTRPTICARRKIRAKTGTLFDTIGLSGLTMGRDGKLKAFSILVNRRPQRYSPLTTRRMVDRGAATITGCY